MNPKSLLNFILFILLLAFGLTSQPLLAANITTSVDRNPVSLDESFKIIFTADDTPDGDPDLSPLEQNFSIVNQSQSSSSSWINGNYSKSIHWNIEVTAKNAGNFTIPAIQFGHDASNSLAITVTQNPSTNDTVDSNQELFLEVKATPEHPFVQSQVIVTVKLYRRVEIAQASLSEPELTDAVIEKLGEDSNYNSVINGTSYLVTERKYAVFPQKSGVMTIKPLSLTAQVLVDRQADFRDIFGSQMTKTKRILSKEITLNVKPAPDSFTGKDWLAAEKLEIKQEWSGDNQQMKIGEPLTRTLTLLGEGTTVGQLPELNTTKTDTNIKAYSDQPVLSEQKLQTGINASRQEKTAIIPEMAGKHVLPAIEIPWFNTKTQTMEVAKIPETTINVIGAAEKQIDINTPAKTAIAPSASQPQSTPETNLNTLALNNLNDWQQNIWFWASLFLLLGWLATVIYFLKTRAKYKIVEEDEDKSNDETNLKESIKKLKAACAEDDIQTAKNALLEWGQQKFSANNLGAVAAHCDARLRDEIILLNETLYGKSRQDWTGKKLLQVFTENKAREKISHADDSVLEPLHRL